MCAWFGQSWRVASRAPSDNALELCAGDLRMHAPAEAAIGAGDHVFATDNVRITMSRSATSSGCSTTFVAWLTTPGIRIFPSGSFTSRHTFHSCSWRALPASTE